MNEPFAELRRYTADIRRSTIAWWGPGCAPPKRRGDLKAIATECGSAFAIAVSKLDESLGVRL